MDKLWLKNAKRYLHEREKLGYCVNKASSYNLMNFVRYVDKHYPNQLLNEKIIYEWVKAAKKGDRVTWATRLKSIYTFLKTIQREQPNIRLPPPGVFGSAKRRLPPYIYTDREIQAILNAAKALFNGKGLSPITYYYYFALLASTGLRVGEGIAINDSDVDCEKKLLFIREGKFHKSRWVPIEHSTAGALRLYRQVRDQYLIDQDKLSFFTPHFFKLNQGRPLSSDAVHHAFKLIRESLHWTKPYRGRIRRVYDLRHTFVSRRMIKWYQQKADINYWLPVLSTYLGHVKVSDTYWYISNVPELMHQASKRFEQFIHYRN